VLLQLAQAAACHLLLGLHLQDKQQQPAQQQAQAAEPPLLLQLQLQERGEVASAVQVQQAYCQAVQG
jgi:hypothetical protein